MFLRKLGVPPIISGNGFKRSVSYFLQPIPSLCLFISASLLCNGPNLFFLITSFYFFLQIQRVYRFALCFRAMLAFSSLPQSNFRTHLLERSEPLSLEWIYIDNWIGLFLRFLFLQISSNGPTFSFPVAALFVPGVAQVSFLHCRTIHSSF